jgi:hypothetical protein
MLAFHNLGTHGRLGNQLWELASTIGVAVASGDLPAFPDTWKYRDYFQVPDEFFYPPAKLHEFENVLSSPKLSHIDPRAQSYMQDIGLWSDYSNMMREFLQPSVYARAKLQTEYEWYFQLQRPIIAVHVRRGDNVSEGEWKAQYHPVPDLDYYRLAAGVVHDRWSPEGVACSYVVFSDDLPWCRSVFSGVMFFEGGESMPKEHMPEYAAAVPTDWIDFFALAQADKFVLSNSTFGWWAAWLSGSDTVTYPQPWYGPALDYIDVSRMFTGLNWRPVNALGL